MSLLKVNEIQIFNGTTVTITATTTETSADLNVGADLDVTGALTLGTALAIAEGGTGATDAATARTNLDVDQAGTDNSTDVSLVTTSHDYLSIAGQAITLGPIDLAADVTGNLPYASISGAPTLGTAAAEDVGYFATAAQGVLADSAVQPGDDANTLGSGAATDGYVLTADGAGGAAWEAASGVSLPIDLLSSGASIRKSDGTTAVLSESGGAVTLENASLGDTVLMPDNSNNVSTAPGIRFEADTDTGIGLASAGNLAVVTGGSERMRIDSSGNLLVGKTSSSSTVQGITLKDSGQGVFTSDGGTGALFNRLTSDGDILEFRKDGTTIGSIGNDGTNLYFVFRTEAATDGCGLRSSGALNGAIQPTDGNGQAVDNHIDFGTAAVRWNDAYIYNGVTEGSDGRQKQDIEELSEAERRVAISAKSLLRKYRWKSRVAEKGDAARIHFGIIAQDLQAAFETEGLDAGRYGMFIHSEWWETEETYTDDDGTEKTRINTFYTEEEAPEGAVKRDRMGIRYSELLAFIIAAI